MIYQLLRILLIMSVAATASAADVHLREQAVCARSLVALGEIAEITGVDAEERQSLEAIELFPAPVSGQASLVRAREVADALSRNGIDLRRLRISGASAVQLRSQPAPAVVMAGVEIPPAAAPLPADVRSSEPSQVVVAVRPLKRGEVVQESDVALQQLNGDAPADQVAVALDEVIGKETLRTFAPGQAISLPQVRKQILVRRNEIITVRARASGIQVRTTARALDDGARGDLVNLQSLVDGNQRFMARVVAHKEAEVFAGRPRTSEPARSSEGDHPASQAGRSGSAWKKSSPFSLRVGSAEER